MKYETPFFCLIKKLKHIIPCSIFSFFAIAGDEPRCTIIMEIKKGECCVLHHRMLTGVNHKMQLSVLELQEATINSCKYV